MTRTKHLIATVAVVALSAAPASAATWEQLKSEGTQATAPPSSIAAGEGQAYEEVRSGLSSQDFRSPDGVDAAEHRGLYAVEDKSPYVLNRAYGSPDAVDAARELPPVQLPDVTIASAPSAGFDWGDAGIGAAGMVALFSVAAGVALLLTGRRRRRGFRVATH